MYSAADVPLPDTSAISTPNVVAGPEGLEVVTHGSRGIRGYDLASGRELWRQLGIGRDWAFEVSVSDPVPWRLTSAYFDARRAAA